MIGARRLTSRARSISSTVNDSERSGGGQGGVCHEDVDLAGVGSEAGDLATVGEVDGQRAGARLRGQRLEHVAAPAGQDQVRATGPQGSGDRLSDAACGAGEKDGGAGDLHEL